MENEGGALMGDLPIVINWQRFGLLTELELKAIYVAFTGWQYGSMVEAEKIQKFAQEFVVWYEKEEAARG